MSRKTKPVEENYPAYELEVLARMAHVDALSRVYYLMLEDSLKYRLKQAQMQDEWTKAIRKILEDKFEDFFIKYHILFKNPEKELIVVPRLMEDEIIKMAYRQGHFSTTKTQNLLEKSFYIPQINAKVSQIVRSRIECIVSEAKSGKKDSLVL